MAADRGFSKSKSPYLCRRSVHLLSKSPLRLKLGAIQIHCSDHSPSAFLDVVCMKAQAPAISPPGPANKWPLQSDGAHVLEPPGH